jgi:hypothetical protein
LRISPLDAKLGFGKGLGLDDKLAGHQLRAFGGFFKKSWRSNDILWGRLDGLNCLLKALITKESIKRFQYVVQRESKQKNIETDEYIERLVEQSIGSSTKQLITNKLNEVANKLTELSKENDNDNELIKRLLKDVKELQEQSNKSIKELQKKLKKLFKLLQGSNNSKELDDLLNELLEQLVEEGQKEIISTDLEKVIEDAIDQQIQWSDIQQKEDCLTTAQNIVQRLLEQKINKKLSSENSGQNDSQENQLRQLNKLNSFFEKLETKSKNNTLNLFQKQNEQNDKQLKQLFQQSLNLDDQGAEKIIDIIISEKISDEKWYEFLKRILRASKQELISPKEKEVENKLNELNQKIEPVLDDVFNSIRPKYDPIIGTLEPTLTMWTATALAEESLNNLKSDDDKADYFQNLYRVSQEELGKDVPLPVRLHLLIKSLLVFRDILVSWRGKKIYKNPLFSLFNFVLSIYESEKYKNYQKLLNWFLLIPVGLFIFCIWQLWLAKPTILVITIVVTTILLLWLLIYLLHSQFDQILKKILK